MASSRDRQPIRPPSAHAQQPLLPDEPIDTRKLISSGTTPVDVLEELELAAANIRQWHHFLTSVYTKAETLATEQTRRKLLKLKSKLSLRLFLVVTAIVALSAPVANAQSVTMNIAGDSSLVNHYPGPDGLIGNGDDVVSGALTAVQSSAPNVNGSLGYNAFEFTPFGQPDPALPVGFDAITFVDGTITIDVGVLTNGGGAIVSALNITSGTEPFPGHGAYTSTISAVNGGTYNPVTKAFTLDVDITYVIFGSQTTESGVVLTGTAIYTDDFGTATGNTYVDTVAVPLAQADGASSLVFFTATGTLPGLGFPIGTTLVAHDGGFNINAGLNDAWVSADAAFQGLFFTVFEDLKLLFLSWFTFDSVQPEGSVMAVLVRRINAG